MRLTHISRTSKAVPSVALVAGGLSYSLTGLRVGASLEVQVRGA